MHIYASCAISIIWTQDNNTVLWQEKVVHH